MVLHHVPETASPIIDRLSARRRHQPLDQIAADPGQALEERTEVIIGHRLTLETSRTNRFLSVITEVASVIVPPEPSTLLRQTCSNPSCQGT